jgi:rhodanese-related sulfurtransferase
MNLTKRAVAAALALALVFSLSACAGKTSHLKATNLGAIIDVRTEDKYVYGHLQGSIGADYQMDTFKDRLANLNRAGHYGVYGKDHDDAANAIRIMIRWGFKHVSNLGSLDEAHVFTRIPEVM